MGKLTRSLVGSAQSLADTFRNPPLRRLLLASAGSMLGTFAYFVALAFYAYQQGGAGAVGLVTVLQLLPAALLAPFLATLADRLPRHLVMIGADLVRATLMVAAAVSIALDGPAWIVYGIVTVVQIAGTAFAPAKAALLPLVARTAGELSAANAAASTIEGSAGFIGPAIGGFVLAATNVQTVFALNAVSFVWSAVLVLGVRVGGAPTGESDESRPTEDDRDEDTGRQWSAGFREIRRNRDIRVLVALYTCQTLVFGAISVLIVVTALDLLHGGPKEIGFFDAAIGVGGLLGAFVALALAARNRLASDFGFGLVLFGALAIVGLAPTLAPAIVALGVLGLGNAIVDVAAITLLQRTVPNDVLARVFGVLDGILLGSIGLGALVIPVLINAFGVRPCLVGVGLLLPVVTALSWRWLRQIDSRAPAPKFTDLLQGVGILAPLPLMSLERLAATLTEVRLPAGATVIRVGEPGDRFYIIGEGQVEIEGKTFGPGSSFGEIALMRDVPRTATVTAVTDVVLLALEREEFLAAVTGHEQANAVADAVISRRLGEMRVWLTTETGET